MIDSAQWLLSQIDFEIEVHQDLFIVEKAFYQIFRDIDLPNTLS